MDSDRLYWTAEAPKRPESVEDRIDEEVFGKRAGYLVSVYDYATLDSEATEACGRNRYKNIPYIAVMVRGEKDYSGRPLDAADKLKFPRAWAAYVGRQGAAPMHALELLPGITAADLREFSDLKITTIEGVVAFDGELHELAQWRNIGRRILNPKPRMRLVDGALVEAA